MKNIYMDKIFFGMKAFNIAYEKKAIDTLIITDGYLRTLPASTRKDLSTKMKELKNQAEVCKFSSMHTTGEKIDEFGDILTPAEVKEILGVGHNTVYALLQSGDIKNFKIGRSRKIPKACLQEYISQKSRNTEP